jgi:hypothetical protein
LKICFVDSSTSNAYPGDLYDALIAELTTLGVESFRASDLFPPLQQGLVYAVIPNEFFENTPDKSHPSQAQLDQTIALSLAPPGLLTYDYDFERGLQMGAIMDVSPVGVNDLRRRGVDARRLTLGWTAAWDNYDASRERSIDVLSYNGGSRRRDLVIGSYAPVLWRHAAWIQRPPKPLQATRQPDWAFGTADRELIGRAKLMLNMRHQSPVYFDWPMAIQAICSGTLWVSEHGAGHAPLVAGEHFFGGDAGNLALMAEGLLRDPDRIASVTADAYELLRSEVLLATGAQQLAETAEDVAAKTVSKRGPNIHEARQPDFTDRFTEGDLATHDPDKLRVQTDSVQVRSAKKVQALAAMAERREQAREQAVAAGLDPYGTPEVHRSPAHDKAKPRVTVCIPLYNHAEEVAEALDSIAGQDFDAFDVLIHDDCSTDDSANRVVEFSEAHPELPLRLVRRSVNAGLPAGRNRMLDLARGEYVLMLDSDNELYPPCITRLAQALDDDPGALFAYPILDIRLDGKPDGLMSAQFWDPAEMADNNPVDAFAMFRRKRLIEFGGYVEDLVLHGWEDYDLYCRCAELGERGQHVPQILARYRRADNSMLSVTNLETESMYARLKERNPTVFKDRLAVR